MSSEKREASPEASPLKGPAPKAVPEDTSDVAFEDGVPLNPMAGDQSVQFISGTPANGDAKVEIGDSATAPTFVGLGKEELMKYANDPFWVKLRWFLFILFWVLWIAMLVGAIVIIVLAPRCTEKKAPAETYYQIKTSDLIKDSKIDENTQFLKDLGIKNIIITEALEHEPNDPEAVTAFDKFSEDLAEGLLTKAIEELKNNEIKVLLQIVPNHSGTGHDWFNETSSERYIRKPYDEVKNTVWMTHDRNKHTAWTKDNRSGFENTAYLQQFSGNVADLNFRDEGIIEAFKDIFNRWRDRGIEGFSIPKASYLVENLDNLMNVNSTINQPENVKVLSRILGISSQGPILVELDDASDETIQEYVAKSMIPVLKSFDGNLLNSDKIVDGLEGLQRNPKAVINLSKLPPAKAQLLNLLVSAGGSHSLINDDRSNSDLKALVEFQTKNPKGKTAEFSYATKGNIVATLRSDGDDHLILANMGSTPDTFSFSALNITAKGEVVFATQSAGLANGNPIQESVELKPLSGLIIKLEKEEEVTS